MPEKQGNGGHGLEAYDPETGRYIAEDKGADGLPKYHAGVHFSVSEIEKMISDGYYGDDIKDYYNGLDEEKKNDMIGYFQQKLDSFYTKQKLEGQKNFAQLDKNKFDQYGKICADNTSSSDRSYFYNNYVGTGDMAFEFNKALRFGIDEYLKRFSLKRLQQAGLTPDLVKKQAEAFDRLCSSFEAPEDMQVFRYDETGPIVSWFRDTGIFDGLPTFVNQYGYTQLVQDNINLDDLANRLSRLIGSVVPRDGAYSSFSCVEGSSHMVKDRNRIIGIKYNVPKGKHCFISQYQYESEGFFPSDTQFIIQDVKREKIGNIERVVLYYGVK